MSTRALPQGQTEENRADFNPCRLTWDPGNVIAELGERCRSGFDQCLRTPMRTFATLTESLSHYQGKREQKMILKNFGVHKGGQAL